MDQFIQVYKKAFSDEFCQKAIKYHNLAEEGGLTKNRQEHDKTLKIEKQDLSTHIPHFPMQHSAPDLMNEFTQVFWEHCYKSYANKFDVLNILEEHKVYTMKIQKTEPGQGYHIWHCESAGRNLSNRVLTWTIYLNDDFEAGETEFLYQQYRYKPSKGDCIIFPAAYTHTHRGNPPIGGDKYIITGWVEF